MIVDLYQSDVEAQTGSYSYCHEFQYVTLQSQAEVDAAIASGNVPPTTKIGYTMTVRKPAPKTSEPGS